MRTVIRTRHYADRTVEEIVPGPYGACLLTHVNAHECLDSAIENDEDIEDTDGEIAPRTYRLEDANEPVAKKLLIEAGWPVAADGSFQRFFLIDWGGVCSGQGGAGPYEALVAEFTAIQETEGVDYELEEIWSGDANTQHIGVSECSKAVLDQYGGGDEWPDWDDVAPARWYFNSIDLKST